MGLTDKISINIMIKDYWYNRNVFVTGATGFLGSWLTKSLVERGSNVTALIRDWVPKAKLVWDGYLDRINYARGDLEDYFLLERILNEYEIDTVFHLGAQTIVGIANNNPVSTFETNIRGTWNILEACRRNKKIKKILAASSDKAYGDQIKLPYHEGFPLLGRHPYDVSKSCADLLCRAYFETYGIPVCVTRCGNFFGGGDLNFNRIIPGTIRSLLNLKPPIIRSDGSFIRDYLYIEDAVGAYLLLAQKMDSLELQGEAFNFSNEIQITVLELVNKIIKLMEADIKPNIMNEAANEIKHQYLSAKKARDVLGWKPQFTLEEGLSRTIDWYRKFLLEEGNK